jgi:proteasome regulatory subunit
VLALAHLEAAEVSDAGIAAGTEEVLSTNIQLHKKIRYLEFEKRNIEREYLRLEKELKTLRTEIRKMHEAPLVSSTLVERLGDDKAVVRCHNGEFVVEVSEYVDQETLVPGSRVALNSRNYAIVDLLPAPKDPLVLGMELCDKPEVSYEDIGGLGQQIQELREIVELSLTNVDLFKKVGVDPPKGVLLYGPPGTGKTLAAKAVARETNATFIRIVGSELVKKYIGEGARMVREIFQFAAEKEPCIIFIDELDAIGARRVDSGTSSDREVQRTLMQLLSEIDGFDPCGNVKVVGATNRSDILDPALLRSGRFDRLIEFPLPDAEARMVILKIHTRKMSLKSVDLKHIAKETEAASGADLKNICTEAGMYAIRQRRKHVTGEDFQDAMTKVLGSSVAYSNEPSSVYV